MMSLLRISVIINNYNYGRFVAQAVESALAQRYPHKEILVVDDGSTDNSREVLSPYAERGVRLIFKENGGQASAFHRGFQEATGDLIAFLDADDYWRPDLLEVLAMAWQPGSAMALWRLQGVDAQQTPLDYYTPELSQPLWSGDIRERFAQSGWYPHPPTSGLAFSREVLRQIFPLDEQTWRISADIPLYTVAPFLGQVVSIDRVLGYYRLHGSNYWQTSSLTPALVLRTLRYDALRDELLRECAQRAGIPHHPRLGRRSPRIVLMRLFVHLLNGSSLMRDDSRSALVRAGLLAALDKRQPITSLARLRYLAFFLAMALLPRPLALHLITRQLFHVRSRLEVEAIVQQGREAVRSLLPKGGEECHAQ